MTEVLDIYNGDFQNWLKGVIALNTTNTALQKTVKQKWEHFISNLSDSEKSHLETFLICVCKNRVKHLETSKNVTNKKWRCEHSLCEKLMNRLLDHHVLPLKLMCKWKFVVPKEKQEEKEGQIPEKKQGDNDSVAVRLGMLYILDENDDTVNDKFCELDISKMIKMMGSCKLFKFECSEDVYKSMITIRNELMHSPDNHFPDTKTREVFVLSEKVLKNTCDPGAIYYKDARQYLQQVEDENFTIDFKPKEHKEVIKSVLEVSKTADDLENMLGENHAESKIKCKQVQDLLKEITNNMDKNSSERGQSSTYRPEEYKSIVQKHLETKKNALQNDIRTVPDGDYQRLQELKCLQEGNDRHLQDVKKIISNPDPCECSQYLKSLTKKKEELDKERNQYKREIERKRNSLQDLQTQTELLKQMVQSQGEGRIQD
ncbi:uncharacterized protein LOC123554698 [Mercenaria mercenaria]|uniref:uncharacterized protein LOC123554698 n=1 Tax=Mercenaria mercenaria TaxID=6596 RepID=UPI00234ECF0E|nr:uncharacterized protein LOC123554698 [Mercenaria mercenaria]